MFKWGKWFFVKQNTENLTITEEDKYFLQIKLQVLHFPHCIPKRQNFVLPQLQPPRIIAAIKSRLHRYLRSHLFKIIES